MRLPDVHRSRAVLIGVSEFLHLPRLPSVASNLQGLSACLGDTDLWGLPKSHCAMVAQPTSSADIIDPVEEAAVKPTILYSYTMPATALLTAGTGSCFSRWRARLRGGLTPRHHTNGFAGQLSTAGPTGASSSSIVAIAGWRSGPWGKIGRAHV